MKTVGLATAVLSAAGTGNLLDQVWVVLLEEAGTPADVSF